MIPFRSFIIAVLFACVAYGNVACAGVIIGLDEQPAMTSVANTDVDESVIVVPPPSDNFGVTAPSVTQSIFADFQSIQLELVQVCQTHSWLLKSLHPQSPTFELLKVPKV